MITLMTGTGLAALGIGAFVIARSRIVGSRANAGTSVPSARVAIQEERGMATRYGLAIMALGAVLALLDFAGVVLSATAVAIVFSLVVAFLVAHHNYAKDRRAAWHERAASGTLG